MLLMLVANICPLSFKLWPLHKDCLPNVADTSLLC